MKYMRSRCDFSMRFRAILDKMIVSLNNNTGKNQIRQIEELQIRDTTRFNDDNTITKKDEFSFIVSQIGMFMIEDDIYCEIESFNDNVESGEKTVEDSPIIRVYLLIDPSNDNVDDMWVTTQDVRISDPDGDLY